MTRYGYPIGPAASAGIPASAAGASAAAGEASPGGEKELLDVLKVSLKDRMDACRKLGVVGTREAVSVLAALLPDPTLSHMARYGLEPNPDPSVEEALRDALGKVKGRELVGVIGSLGVRRDAKAVEALVRLLQDSDRDVVGAAARSLGRIGTPDAARALRERLGSAPAALRPDLADGCLACAERLVAAPGGKAEAVSLYEAVAKADLLPHVRQAGEAGARSAR